MYANFLLGELHCSDAVCAALGRTPLDLVARHAVNEHGQITPRENMKNQRAMKEVGEILSRYMVDPTNPRLGHVLVITSECWSDTHVKLESEL